MFIYAWVKIAVFAFDIDPVYSHLASQTRRRPAYLMTERTRVTSMLPGKDLCVTGVIIFVLEFHTTVDKHTLKQILQDSSNWKLWWTETKPCLRSSRFMPEFSIFRSSNTLQLSQIFLFFFLFKFINQSQSAQSLEDIH